MHEMVSKAMKKVKRLLRGTVSSHPIDSQAAKNTKNSLLHD